MSKSDIKNSWQSQPSALPLRSPEDLRAEAESFQRKIARRNVSEYVGGAVVIPVFSFYIWYFPYWVTRLGAALVVLGALVVMWQIHRRVASRAVPEDFASDGLQFQRRELSRQRDALRSVWLWYLGPLLPGMVVFMWGIQGGAARGFEVLVDLVMVVAFAAVAWLNRRAAVRLQRRIDMLDALAESSEGT